MVDIAKIQKSWTNHEARLEKSLKLNIDLIRKINVKSAKSKMNSLIWLNALTLVFYQASLWFCLYFTVTHRDNIFYLIAGALLVTWSAIISFGAIKQLKLIIEIDYSGPVTQVQKQLQEVKIAIVHFLRMAFMILPIYVVFPVIIFELMFGINFIETVDPLWLITQSLVLIFPTAWIYRNLSPKNVNKKWINWLLHGNGSQINEAQNFMLEIEKFEQEV